LDIHNARADSNPGPLEYCTFSFGARTVHLFKDIDKLIEGSTENKNVFLNIAEG
jgi:hypothetical protein